MLVDDWCLHLLHFGVFLSGFGVAKHAPLFENCLSWHWAPPAIAPFADAQFGFCSAGIIR